MIFYFIPLFRMANGTTPELMNVGMVSALVGLFSDKAVKKLSDILYVLLAAKDDRKAKVKEDPKEIGSETKLQKAATPAQPGAAPKFNSTTPASIPPNADTAVEFKGSNFKAGFKVKLNGVDATPTQQTERSFKLDIPRGSGKGTRGRDNRYHQ